MTAPTGARKRRANGSAASAAAAMYSEMAMKWAIAIMIALI
jgi:hypothetical protein